ncbi:conserved hypothetical protein [Candidatus Nitrospira nitrosa]|uniref:Uncharacterized protein n=1 Tax=Candidatus Nitrospira nitrosa TaxID=1742972 RepID=A0A0S4LTN4_9BACT|nr:hypothetical protein [Candidatus Nitrospira nitrosa]CUS38402.1 conserved hypothetical protein [Candidatus Nitrospira nitrosa]
MRESNDTPCALNVRVKSSRSVSIGTASRMGTLVIGLVLVMLTGCAASFFKEETVADRFDKAMKKLAERCAKEPPKRGDTTCDPLKLKPTDPLATEEGRFAHSIKIPNPLPEDSGYKPGMTTKEYFDHLCKNEAGEFIFKTVENVEGIMQMRPRTEATDYMLQHLYALEDPYGEVYGEEFNAGPDAIKAGIQNGFVNPRYSDAAKTKDGSKRAYRVYRPDRNYKFLEKPIPVSIQSPTDGSKYLRYTRPNTDKLVLEDGQYLYPGDQQPTLLEEWVKQPKSEYGFTWRGITRPHDRELGIAGGEVIILDLQTKEVLAVKRGYLASGRSLQTVGRIWWLGATACPPRPVTTRKEFIHKVLKPSQSVN